MLKSSKLLFYVASLAFVVLIMGVSFHFTDAASAATSRMAQIEKVTGDVTVRKAGGSKSFVAYRNMHLNEGDHLTTGSKSSVVLKVLDVQDEIVVGENSKLYIEDLKEEAGKKKSSFKIWFGSLWTKANPSGSSNNELEIETPTAVMGVRGTQFQVTVDPLTGRQSLFVLDGVVAASPKANREVVDTNVQEQLIYPGQQRSSIPGLNGEIDSILTMMDAESIASSLDPTIIENLLRNKQNIYEENEQWLQQLRSQMDENILRNLLSIEDLEMYQTQLNQLLDVLISNAVKNGNISREQVEGIIRQVREETNQPIEVDFKKETLDMTDQQKQKLDRLKELEQRRQEQLKKEQERKDEIAERNQELLNRLEQQRRQQEELNRQAMEDRKREAQEKHLENLQDEQRRQLEERVQQREEENRNQSRPAERPEYPVYTGGGGNSNHAPKARNDLNISIPVYESFVLYASNLATDQDGDELSFVGATSADEEVVMIGFDEPVMYLQANSPGTTEITVKITDGIKTVDIIVPVTVFSSEDHIYGKIITPDPAPAGGIPITIVAEVAQQMQGIDPLVIQVTVPEGWEEVYYYIEVPQNMMQASFYISYEIDESSVSRYVRKGTHEQAVQLGQSVYFNLIEGNSISGMVNIPEPAPAGGEEIIVVVQQEIICEQDSNCVSDSVRHIEHVAYIPEGEQSVPYTLWLPPGEDYYVYFTYNDYDDPLFDGFGYVYLDVERLIEMLEDEGIPIEEGALPDYWLETGRVGIWPWLSQIAPPLDLSSEDQTGIDLNIPGEIPEYELMAKNDMILFKVDPENEKKYTEVLSMLNLEYSFTGKNIIITDLEPNESYVFRFLGIYGEEEFIIPLTDIKKTVVTSSEPELEAVELMQMSVFWNSYQGAAHYNVYVYKQGDVINNQFTDPASVTLLETNNRIDAFIPNLEYGASYIIRIEAIDQQGTLLAGTTLSIEN